MPYLPGRVIPRCEINGAAEVRIAGLGPRAEDRSSVPVGRVVSVPIGDRTDETKTVEVEFLGDRVDPTPIKVTVEAGKMREVMCQPAR
jgi:hypothetical protein